MLCIAAWPRRAWRSWTCASSSRWSGGAGPALRPSDDATVPRRLLPAALGPAEPPRPTPGPCAAPTSSFPAPRASTARPATSYIDPVRPVPRALITHAHSDHARPGHGAVLATRETLDIMALRLGADFAAATQAAAYGERRSPSATPAPPSTPPATSSAPPRSRWSARGLRIVAAGDYKRSPDPTCAALRAGPLRHLHHRGDLRPAGLPPPAAAGRDRAAPRLARPVPRPHPPRRRLRARQGAAVIRLLRDAGYDAPDLPPRRAPPALRLLRCPRHRPRRAPRRHRSRAAARRAFAGADRPRPALRLRRHRGSAASPTR